MTSELNLKIIDLVKELIENSSPECPAWSKEKGNKGTNDWNYVDGCMIKAILALYDVTHEERYLQFSRDFIDWFLLPDGKIKQYDMYEYNLDSICGASNLITLFEITGDEKYRIAMEIFHEQLLNMPRTLEGSFWHKKIYPNQVWLDGLFMAQPFYMGYETRYNDLQGCKDSFQQFCNVEKHMKNQETGLYYHGYDESRTMYWADQKTGCSPNYWLRAIGWFAAALVDTASTMDEALYYEYRRLRKMLWDLAEAVLKWQQDNGMFYQLVDRPGEAGNYLETSGTALLVYALLKGTRLGYLTERFAKAGEKAFYGIVSKYFKEDTDGKMYLGGICLVAGLGGKDHRDGSTEYYYSEPIVENDAKGIAPFLLAYTEIIKRQ